MSWNLCEIYLTGTCLIFFIKQRASRIVNDNMSVRMLFEMAIAFLNLELGFSVDDARDIDLVYEDTLMRRDNVLGSIPVLRGAQVHVIVPMEDSHLHPGATPSRTSGREVKS
jgi:hypothetical protein